MEANELRCNNLVLYKGEVYEVEWISWESPFDPKDYSPIPLTEEWLLKFDGFIDDSIGNNLDKIERTFYNVHSLIFSKTDEPLIYYWSDCYEDEFYSKNIGQPLKYVH